MIKQKFKKAITALLCGGLMFAAMAPPAFAMDNIQQENSNLYSTAEMLSSLNMDYDQITTLRAVETIGGTGSVDIPDNFKPVVELSGTGTSLSTTTWKLKKGNTYYIELAGGQGGNDSWYRAGESHLPRRGTFGGKGGYQILKIVPTSDTTLTIYAGGQGNYCYGGGAPDGQTASGGGSSSIWIGTPGNGGVLLAAAGGGGGAVGGTSGVRGYDGLPGTGTGTSTTNAGTYTNFDTEQDGQKGRTWWGWEESSQTAEWRDIVIDSLNYYDTNAESDDKDRIKGWDSSMDPSVFFNAFILHGDNIEGGGGGGGFPTGTCTYFHWGGWYPYTGYGWQWIVNDQKYNISTGGTGYTMSTSKMSSSYGLTTSYAASDGVNEGEGYAVVWAESFTLTVDPNGGVFQSSYAPTVYNREYLDTLAISDPERPGYTFLGWDKVINGTNKGLWNATTKVYTFQKYDETWTAQWEKDIYSITYTLNGGKLPSGKSNPSYYYYDSDTIVLVNPERSGYLFLGWTGTGLTSTVGTVEIPKGSTGNRSYTANWQKLGDLPLLGTPNLTYKPRTMTDANGTSVGVNLGGVDLNWSGYNPAFSPKYNVYYRGVGTEGWAGYNGGAQFDSTVKTLAFADANDYDRHVYDNQAPNAPTTSEIVKTDTQATIKWNTPNDNGRTFEFKVTAIEEYATLQPWQKILNTAGYSMDVAKSCTSFAAMIQNTTYVDQIRSSSNASALIKSYYSTSLNNAIDTYYSDALNSLNYALGLKCYIIRNGACTSILPADKWSYGAYYSLRTGGDADESGDDPAWVAFHDAGMFKTESGAFIFGNGSGKRIQFKSFAAINTARYAGGKFVVQSSRAGANPTTNTYGFSNSSGRFHNTINSITYFASYTNSGKTFTNSVPNWGDRGGSVSSWTQSKRNSWAESQWGYGIDGGSTLSNGYILKPANKELESQWGFASSVDVADGTGTINLTSSNTSTSQYLQMDPNGGYQTIKATNMYLQPGSVAADNTAAGAPSQTASNESNIATVNVTTGIKGYLYKIDTVENTTISWSNGTWTAANSVSTNRSTTTQYLHVAAVDKAGHVSTTYTVTINPDPVEVEEEEEVTSITYEIHYHGYGDARVTATSTHTQDVPQALKENSVTVTGYKFSGWDTDPDADTVVYQDKQVVVNLSNINGGVVDLYAVLKTNPISYTIRYNANKGTGSIPDMTLRYDEEGYLSANENGEITREYHEFVGWSKTPDGSVNYIPGATVKNLSSTDGDIVTLYAVWVQSNYKVNFNGNGATSGSMSPVTLWFDFPEKLPANKFVNTGHTFTGWATSASGAKQYNDQQEVVNLVGKNSGTTSITLYAKWTINSYDLTIDPNGGYRVSDRNTQKVVVSKNYNTTEAISERAREGYTLTGYVMTNSNSGSTTNLGGATFTFDPNTKTGTFTQGTEPITLTAQWQVNTYTTRFDPNGGYRVSDNNYNVVSYNYTYGATDGISERRKNGYILTGYTITNTSDGSNNIGGATVTFDSDTKTGTYKQGSQNVTVTAQWTPITYEVKYNGNGSTSGSMTNSQHTYDVSKNLTANAFKRAYTVTYNANGGSVSTTSANAAYTFSGWATTSTGSVAYSDKASVKNLTTTNNAIVNLYAKWNGGVVTLPTPTRNGYEFEGWYDAASGGNKVGGAGSSYTVTSNITLYAHWKSTNYTVNYDGNQNTGGSTASSTHSYGVASTLTPNGFTRSYTVTYNGNTGTPAKTSDTSNYTFKNWNTNAAGTGTSYADKASVTTLTTAESITLYAQWTPVSVTLPSASKDGYTFNGWYSAASGGTKIGNAGAAYTPTAGITLYAQWTPIAYQVKYNGNGSTSGSMNNSSHTYDVPKALTANAFQKSYTVTYNANTGTVSTTSQIAKYDFSGWATSSSGSVKYADKASVNNLTKTSGAVVNLYAKWTGGTVTLPTPTKQGYTFAGWYTAASGGSKVGGAGDTYTATANITLYAQWTPNGYIVNYNGNGNTGGSTATSNHTYDVSSPLTANGFTRKYTVTYNGNNGTPAKTSEVATYTFKNWNTNAAGTGSTYTDKQNVINLTTSGTFNLYAQWNSASVTLPTATRTGYTLTGWYTAATGGTKVGVAGSSYTPTVGVTLYAQWRPNTVTVVYHSNNATEILWNKSSITEEYLNSNLKQVFQYNTNTTDGLRNGGDTNGLMISKTGYTFSTNWIVASPTGSIKLSQDKAFTGQELAAAVGGSINTGDITVHVYAEWNPNTYLVRYNGNGNTSGTMENTRLTYDVAGKLAANKFTKTGYHFIEWNTKENGSGTPYANEATVLNLTHENNGIFDVYAQWNANTYTVVYDGNGHTSGAMNPSTHVYDTSKKLTKNTYEKVGYIFTGWSTNKNGGGSSYTDEQSVLNLTSTNGGTVRLYAQWTPIKYKIEYNGNQHTGGSMDITPELTYDVAYNLDANQFTKEHHKFVGWATSPSGDVVYTDRETVKNLTTVDGDTITLYAVWDDLRVYVSGSTTNLRTGVKNIYKAGEQGRLEVTTTGYATNVTATFPAGIFFETEDHVVTVAIPHPVMEGMYNWNFYIPLLCRAGEYTIQLDAENTYGYTATSYVTITVTNESILDEIRTRLR